MELFWKDFGNLSKIEKVNPEALQTLFTALVSALSFTRVSGKKAGFLDF